MKQELLFSLLTAAAIADASAAGAFASVVASQSGSTPATSLLEGTVWVGPIEVVQGDAKASAAAHLHDGNIRVKAESPNSFYGSAHASAGFADRVRFSVPNPISTEFARLYWVFSASVSPDFGSSAQGSSYAAFHLETGAQTVNVILTNGPCPSTGYDSCKSAPSGTPLSVTFTGSINWSVYNTIPFNFTSSMAAHAAGPREWADAFNSAHFYLEVPQGVQVTSDSGTFLAGASPIPEPSRSTMLYLGLIGGALWAQRRVLRDK